MRRGEVRWVTFDGPERRRPVIILTRNSAIGYLNSLTVAPISTTIRRVPSQVFIGQEDGLPTEGAVNLHNLQTVHKSRIGSLITTLSTSKLIEVEQALVFALDIHQLPPS